METALEKLLYEKLYFDPKIYDNRIYKRIIMQNLFTKQVEILKKIFVINMVVDEDPDIGVQSLLYISSMPDEYNILLECLEKYPSIEIVFLKPQFILNTCAENHRLINYKFIQGKNINTLNFIPLLYKKVVEQRGIFIELQSQQEVLSACKTSDVLDFYKILLYIFTLEGSSGYKTIQIPAEESPEESAKKYIEKFRIMEDEVDVYNYIQQLNSFAVALKEIF